VPAQALRSGPELAEAGLRGVYLQGAKDCAMSRAEGRLALRDIGVRYVVTGWGGKRLPLGALGLAETYRGEGVRIYEVPEGD
jgi:hypothetical protein